MKKIIFTLFIFISTILLAIEVNQDVELTNYLNARYSARFTKEDQNIAGQLSKGTKGNIREIKTFSSGNSGFLIEVKSGELKGQKVWVYYNKDAPSLKLTDEKQKPTAEPAQADQAQTTRAIDVFREPVTSRSVLGQLDQVSIDIAKINPAVPGGTVDCLSCNKENPDASPGVSTALSANGDINARIKCSHKSDLGLTLPGSMQLEIENNKVKYINATVNGCTVNSEKFKQVLFSNKNIAMEDSNGCRIVIYNSLNVRGSTSPTINFGMVPTSECVKSCAKVEKKFWQVEMNPNSQTCY